MLNCELKKYAMFIINKFYNNIRITNMRIHKFDNIYYRVNFNCRDEDGICMNFSINFTETDFNIYLRKAKLKKLKSYAN